MRRSGAGLGGDDGSPGGGAPGWRRGGQSYPKEASLVATDGGVTAGPNPKPRDFIGGFTVVDVPSRAEALAWAARIAQACRCAQEVRPFLADSYP
jgi:hypothetical protein